MSAKVKKEKEKKKRKEKKRKDKKRKERKKEESKINSKTRKRKLDGARRVCLLNSISTSIIAITSEREWMHAHSCL